MRNIIGPMFSFKMCFVVVLLIFNNPLLSAMRMRFSNIKRHKKQLKLGPTVNFKRAKLGPTFNIIYIYILDDLSIYLSHSVSIYLFLSLLLPSLPPAGKRCVRSPLSADPVQGPHLCLEQWQLSWRTSPSNTSGLCCPNLPCDRKVLHVKLLKRF